MAALDYWKVVINSTLQHEDDDGYIDSEENCTCPVSWLCLLMVLVSSKNIKGSYLLKLYSICPSYQGLHFNYISVWVSITLTKAVDQNNSLLL